MLFSSLDSVRDRWNVLRHPFYVRWSRGELTSEELAFYAGEYRHAVVALAEATARASRSADEPALREQLERHADEERAHVQLWDDFAAGVGAEHPGREPLDETRECIEAWTAGGEVEEGLVILYAVESAQPAISATKLAGLVAHHDFVPGEAASAYFELHSELDDEHAAQSRAALERRARPERSERLVALAEHALRTNWRLLDGVERRFGRDPGDGL